MEGNMLYYIIFGGFALISMLISSKLKSKFAHYSKLQLSNGMSGKEIAERMLSDNGVHDVSVISTPGHLTDHYDPTKKTVNLSEGVYNGRSAAAAAVAAHECGHAIQHKVGYNMLQLRSKMVPAVQFSSNLLQWVLFGGIALMAVSGNKTLLAIGVALFAVTTIFAFVTLPVEYDASNRALKWLKERNMVQQEELAGAEDSLKWAARTYVAAAVGSLAQLLYFGSMLLGKRE